MKCIEYAEKKQKKINNIICQLPERYQIIYQACNYAEMHKVWNNVKQFNRHNSKATQTNQIIIIIFSNIYGKPNRRSFFIICSASAVHVQSVYICGLTQQVCIGRKTTSQGCETSFLSLDPDVISLT